MYPADEESEIESESAVALLKPIGTVDRFSFGSL
jgi:hypothetical protein